MPLSFRRSFKRLPSTDLTNSTRRSQKTAAVKAVRPSEEFRPTKYPLIIPIGCGAAVGLCLFLVFSRGLGSLPRPRSVVGGEVGLTSTSIFETALAGQLATLEALRPSALPAALSTQSPTKVDMPATATTSTTEVRRPPNPWSADIPNADCIPADLPQTGRVVEVVGVDTMRVLLDGDGHVYSVRYLGADASQVNRESTAFQLQALQRHTDLVFRKQAILVRDISDADINGTLLRYVLIDGVFINHALVAEGLARAGSSAPDTACLADLLTAEAQAQAAGRGMWAVHNPNPSTTATP